MPLGDNQWTCLKTESVADLTVLTKSGLYKTSIELSKDEKTSSKVHGTQLLHNRIFGSNSAHSCCLWDRFHQQPGCSRRR